MPADPASDPPTDRTDVEITRTGSGRPHFDVRRRIESPRETVWALLTDTGSWPDWGPSVRAVEPTNTVIEPNTTGRIRTVGGLWLPFRITDCADYRWTWRVARIPATGHRVEALESDTCRVVFEVPLVAAGYIPVCKRALSKIDSLATQVATTD
ncbi:MAG: SRPBCC family protein [Halobacteriales archaeon]